MNGFRTNENGRFIDENNDTIISLRIKPMKTVKKVRIGSMATVWIGSMKSVRKVCGFHSFPVVDGFCLFIYL